MSKNTAVKTTNDNQEVLAELNRRLDPGARNKRDDFLDLVPHIKCSDGFKLSVQASKYHYCSPRENGGFWHQVEVGYPTRRTKELMPFAEDAKTPTKTVYGFVPIGIVAKVIARHGGFAKA